MNRRRVNISQYNDWDMRHYEFVRRSGLPRDTFASDRWIVAGDLFAIAVCVIGFVVALYMGWGGQ